jgi:hypothetical protein
MKAMPHVIDIQMLVDRLHADCREAHRGAFWWDEDERIAVFFGNDGSPTEDLFVKEEVAAVRTYLRTTSGTELAFAVKEDITWALACHLPDHLGWLELSYCVWDIWMFRRMHLDQPMPEPMPRGFWPDVIHHIDWADYILERNGLTWGGRVTREAAMKVKIYERGAYYGSIEWSWKTHKGDRPEGWWTVFSKTDPVLFMESLRLHYNEKQTTMATLPEIFDPSERSSMAASVCVFAPGEFKGSKPINWPLND